MSDKSRAKNSARLTIEMTLLVKTARNDWPKAKRYFDAGATALLAAVEVSVIGFFRT